MEANGAKQADRNFNTRILVGVLSVLAFIVATFVAWLQPPALSPFIVPERFSIEWWLNPMEVNAYKRAPVLRSGIMRVRVLPDGQIWAVGQRGLILHSPDGGRCWEAQGPWARRETSDVCTGRHTFDLRLFSEAQAAEMPGAIAIQAAGTNESSAQPPAVINNQTTSPTASQTPSENSYSESSSSKPAINKSQERIPKMSNSPADGIKKVSPGSTQALPNGSPNLSDIWMHANGRDGWAVGDNGTVIATSDGGKIWREIQSAERKENLNAIAFSADGWKGWTVGDNGTIFEITDGGKIWKKIKSTDSNESLRGVVVTADGQHGWAVGDNGTIAMTADDGKNWNWKKIQFKGINESLRGVYFAADGQHGWVVGSNGAILATADGGDTWQPQLGDSRDDLNAVIFAVDGAHGWAVGDNGTVVATADSGNTWRMAEKSSGTTAKLFGIAISADGKRTWIAGENGTIMASTDGSENWLALTTSSKGELNGVAFVPNGQRGWAVGDRRIMATSDGGASWQVQIDHLTESLNAVAFDGNGLQGCAVGNQGAIFITADGGKSWSKSKTSDITQDLFGAFLTQDGRRGWAVGGGGTIIATTDGGNTWKKWDGAQSEVLRSVVFANDGRRGWAVSIDGSIIATTDGGESWLLQTKSENYLSSIAFAADGRHGWALGGKSVVVTTNDGESWQTKRNSDNEDFLINGVTFSADGKRGWAVGEDGGIKKTSDGGNTWSLQNSTTRASLNGISFAADGRRGWAVGRSGTIILTTDGGDTWQNIPYTIRVAPWWWGALVVTGLVLLVTGWPRKRKVVSEYILGIAVSDRPLRASDPNTGDTGVVAQMLFKFLSNPATQLPLTIAISGKWGMGKSSLMQLLRDELKRKRYRTVWFNAWHHQRGEQLLASLFAHIREQAVPSISSTSGLLFYWRLFWRRARRQWFLFGVLGAVFLATTITQWQSIAEHCGSLWNFLSIPENWRASKLMESIKGIWQSLNEEQASDLIQRIATLFGLGGPLFALVHGMRGFGLDPRKLVQLDPGNTSARSVDPGARARFAREFCDVTLALGTRGPFIFIDDLDRCASENLMEILETVNLLATSGECAVIMAMDFRSVEAAVAHEQDAIYEARERFGHNGDTTDPIKRRHEFVVEYLEKLINLRVPVPKLDHNKAQHILNSRVSDRWLGRVTSVCLEIKKVIFPGWNEVGELSSRFDDFDRKYGWVLRRQGQYIFQWGLVIVLVGAGAWWGVGAMRAPEPAGISKMEWHLLSDTEFNLAVGKDGSQLKIRAASGLADRDKSADDARSLELLLASKGAFAKDGFVVGKLGDGSNTLEMVLRPQTKAAVVTGNSPIKEVIKNSKKGSSEIDEASFVSGRKPEQQPLIPWLIPLCLALVAWGESIRRRWESTEDSKIFNEALNIWLPWLLAARNTPRGIKRYLNQVRYQSLRLEGWLSEPMLVALMAIHSVFPELRFELLEADWFETFEPLSRYSERGRERLKSAVDNHTANASRPGWEWPPTRKQLEIFFDELDVSTGRQSVDDDKTS